MKLDIYDQMEYHPNRKEKGIRKCARGIETNETIIGRERERER